MTQMQEVKDFKNVDMIPCLHGLPLNATSQYKDTFTEKKPNETHHNTNIR
jgi:hypothetical protein